MRRATSRHAAEAVPRPIRNVRIALRLEWRGRGEQKGVEWF